MTRARFLVQTGTYQTPAYGVREGYRQALHLDNETYYFGVAKTGRGWTVYELTTGVQCAWGTTRINALDECRRSLPEIAYLLKKADTDPNNTLARAKRALAEFAKQSAESALE